MKLNDGFDCQGDGMLTLFTIPKAFAGQVAVTQRNAIRSWLCWSGECEVFLCGDDPGVADVASELRLHHLPGVRRNEYGTPLLDDAFSLVAKAAKGTVMVYLNSDIILLSDLTDALRHIHFRRFLVSGRRRNLDVTAPIDFSTRNWRERTFHDLQTQGQLDSVDAMDYFAFPRAMEWKMPGFAVGRPGWDNWMAYRARVLGIPFVDATDAISIVHQNHAYGHVAGARAYRWNGPEGDRNRFLAGGKERAFTLCDATHRLSANGLQRISRRKRLHRELNILNARHPSWSFACRIGHMVVTFRDRFITGLCRRLSVKRDD
jgi:hypothetical protein